MLSASVSLRITGCIGVVAAFLPVMLAEQGTGVVEGVVVSSVTRVGVAGVTVELTAQGAEDAAYHATTDSAGAFRFTNVAAGTYLPSYERSGFATPDEDPSDKKFSVTAGSAAVRLREELVPLAELSGSVMDGDGKPAAKVEVDCVERHTGQVHIVVSTDDAGRFAINGVTPGTYFLRAAPGSNYAAFAAAQTKSNGQAEKHVDVSPDRKLWPTTYYPQATDRLLASPIMIHGGENMQGLDIRLQQIATFRVRGMVVDERGDGVRRARVALKPADSVEWIPDMPPVAQVMTKDDGSFEFPSVGAGKWRLIAEIKNETDTLLGFTRLEVTKHDLEEVRTRLAAPFTLTALVEGLSQAQNGGPRPRRIRLIPVDGPREQEVYSGPPKDGRIQARVYPGRYRFAAGSPAGYYLAAILSDGRDVMADEVDLSASSATVRLIYRADGGRVSGAVEKGAWNTVVMFPQNPALLFHNLYMRSSQCDADGRFEIAGIRPGDYYAIAVERVDWNALSNPAFVAGIARDAVRVRVEPGAGANVELRVQAWPE